MSQGTKKAAPASPSPGLARKCFGIHIDAASAAIEDNQCTWCFVKYVDTAMYVQRKRKNMPEMQLEKSWLMAADADAGWARSSGPHHSFFSTAMMDVQRPNDLATGGNSSACWSSHTIDVFCT